MQKGCISDDQVIERISRGSFGNVFMKKTIFPIKVTIGKGSERVEVTCFLFLIPCTGMFSVMSRLILLYMEPAATPQHGHCMCWPAGLHVQT